MKNKLLYYSTQLYTDRIMEQKQTTWKDFVDFHADLEVAPIKYERKVFSPVKWQDPNNGQVLSNVEHVDLLTLDIDNGVDKQSLDKLTTDIKDFAHSLSFTYSCRKSLNAGNGYRLRLIFPLAKSIMLNDWDAFWFKATGLFPYIKFDPQCSNANRSFLLPAVPDEETFEWFKNNKFYHSYNLNSKFFNAE